MAKQSKKTRQEQVIELLKKNYSSDKAMVINNTPKELLVVLGNSRNGHNRLIKHTYANKYNQVVKSSTVVSFADMVKENAVEIEVVDKEIKE